MTPFSNIARGRRFTAPLRQQAEYSRHASSLRATSTGFIAGQDFTPKSGKTSEAGGRPRIDHIISLEMAKEICMIQRSPLGNQARQYYIECERRARNNVPALSGPELVARALIEAQNMLEEKDQQIKELAPRAGAWETFCESSGDMSVADTAKALNSRRGVLRTHHWWAGWCRVGRRSRGFLGRGVGLEHQYGAWV